MNKLRSWFHFHAPERRFHQLSYQLAELAPRLNRLNERRRVLQRNISGLGSQSDQCRICPGRCCRGAYNHFTPVDCMIRMFSDCPVPGYGEIWKPEPISSLWLSKSTVVCGEAGGALPETNCPELSETGCRLEPAERPVRCILWTCRAFRESLPEPTLEKIGTLNKELEELAGQAVALFNPKQCGRRNR
ncbi:MAG TPA: hypothetical protein VJ550_10880 [Geomonas sp.]|nr:hypothetical protein [Geomonas sp.]